MKGLVLGSLVGVLFLQSSWRPSNVRCIGPSDDKSVICTATKQPGVAPDSNWRVDCSNNPSIVGGRTFIESHYDQRWGDGSYTDVLTHLQSLAPSGSVITITITAP